jgi:hypothetical protein
VVTSCSRISGSQPGAVVLLGEHGVELAAQDGLHRRIGCDRRDGMLEQAAVVAQLVGGQRVERVLGRGGW